MVVSSPENLDRVVMIVCVPFMTKKQGLLLELGVLKVINIGTKDFWTKKSLKCQKFL